VCTTDSSVEENLRLAGDRTLDALETRRVPEPWKRGDGAEQCSPRQTRKEGTDVGWRLRADLHHDGDPGCARLGCGLSLLVYRERQRNPSPRDGGRQGTQGGLGRGTSVRVRGGPVVRSTFGRCDPVRVLVAGGQGQPRAHRKLARPRLTVGPAQSEGSARRVPIERPARAVMEGGNAYPSCLGQASLLRDTRTGDQQRATAVVVTLCAHAGSSGERWRHRSGLNGQEGADPSDGERLPTRRKPSKGEALVGMRTSSEANPGHQPGDAARHRAHDGSAETQRTPCPVPGCNRPGTHAAEETVEVVEDHRGGT
jgi:hypothetical protein